MRLSTALLFAAGSALTLAPSTALAQSVIYSQNFNLLGGGFVGDADFAGWNVYTGATSTSLGTAQTATNVTTTAGSTTTWADSGGKFKNFAAASTGSTAVTATQTNATDRALGVRTTGSFGDPGAAFAYTWDNSTYSISSISIDLQMLSVQGRSQDWSVQIATGAAPTSWTTLETVSDTGVFGSTTKTYSLGSFASLSTLDGSANAWFRVVSLTNATGTGSRDSFAIDNFSISASILVIATGNYWAPGASGGGAGTWSSSSKVWSETAGAQGTGSQATSGALLFGGTAGTVTVSGTVTTNAGLTFSTDGYTLTGGTVTLGGANAAANTLTVNSAVGTTINSALSAANGLTKAGTGTLTLGGSNTLGAVTVSAGNLVLANTSALGSTASGTTVSSGATLDLNGQTIGAEAIALSGSLANGSATAASLSGLVTASGSAGISTTGNLTLSGGTAGSGSIAKSGNGTLTLSGSNAHTGGTTVSAGTLNLTGTTSATGTFSVANGATLTGNGTIGGALSIESGGAINLSTIAGASTLTAGSLSLTGATLTFELGDLISLGSGALSLSSVTTINFTGAISAATYKLIGFGSSSGTDANFSVTTPAGRWSAVGSLAADGYYVTLDTLAANLTWNGGSGTWDDADTNWIDGASASTKFTGGDNVTIAGTSNQTITLAAGLTVGNVALANTAGTTTLTGSGFAGSGNVTKTGAGTAVLSSANTFTGTVTVSAGTLRVVDAAALGSNTAGTSVSAGATLDLNGQTIVNEALTLSGVLANSSVSSASFSGAVTLTDSATVETGGNLTLSGAVGGSGSLTKSGNGTLTLSGTNNFSGGTTISAGSLVGTTSSLQGNITNNASLTFDQAGNGTYAGALSGSGSLTKLGNGTVTLSGAASHSGGTTVSAGGLTISGTLGGDLTVSGGTATLSASDRLANTAAVNLSSGTLALGANNDTVGSFALTGGSLTGTGTLTAATYAINGGTLSANLGAGAATATSGSTALNGTLAADLTVSGGTVTLGAADRISNTSTVAVSSGSLALGSNSDTVGSFAISGGSLAGTGTLTAATYALSGGTVTANLGAGAATAASGSTALNGTLAASLTVSGGTVTLGSADRIANAAAVSVSSGSLALGGNDTVGSFAISGGSLAGSGTLTASTYALTGGTVSANLGAGAATAASGSTALAGTLGGNLAVSGGTVSLGSAGRLGASAAVTVSSGTLTLGGNESVGAFTQSGGSVGGTGTLTATTYELTGGSVAVGLAGSGATTVSSGTSTLSGDNSSYSGAVAVNSGSLIANASGSLGSGIVTLASGANLLAGAGTTHANAITVAAPVARGFIISEYVEGSSNNKYIELFNGTSSAIDLSQYQIRLYANGTSGVSVPAGVVISTLTSGLTELASGATLVLRNPSASTNNTPGVTTYSATGITFFNGDDTFALERTDGTAVDIFGIIGNDPGTAWTIGSNTTLDRTLVRNANVFAGVSVNPTGTGATGFATLGSEWTSFANDTFSNLGSHTMNAAVTSPSTLGINEAGAATFSGNVTIHGAATLTAAASGTATFSGILSGAGSVTKTGNGTVTLTGANTYSGGTTISAGTLVGTTTSLQRDITNNAALTFDQAGNGSYEAVISGTGSLTKTGNGIVTLTGANTYEGGTTISAGKLIIGNIGSLGSGSVAVSGGILDLNNLAPTNVILVSGGSLLNASAWAALGAVQLSGNVGSDQINNLGADITEVKVAAGATVNLAGVTKDIVFEGGTLTNLADFGSGRKIKVKGSLDVSAGDHGGDIEVAAGGTLDFGNRSTDRSVKFAGGAITGANFTGTVDVDSAAGTVDLTSSIGAGNVRLGNGAAASIQSGFSRDLRLEDGATLSGLNNYSGELTVAAPTFSTSGITTSATIAIESGTKLTGTGTVGSVVQVAGSTLAPGNSPGILNVTGAHVLAGGAAMEVEFYDLATSQVRGTAYDAVTAGTLDLSGLTTLSRYTLNLISLSTLPSTQGALAGFDNSTPYLFELFTYATLTLPASYTGSIADLFTISAAGFDDANGNAVTGSWTVFNNTGTSTLELQYSPIPEPSTYGLILGGLALAGAAIRRRKQKTSK